MTKMTGWVGALAYVVLFGCGESSVPDEQGGTGASAASGGDGAASGNGGSGGSGGGGEGGSDSQTFCDACEDDGGFCWWKGCSKEVVSCTWRPSSCPPVGPPVCGCDGQVYANMCEAQRAQVDIGPNQHCVSPPGLFSCGIWLFCVTGKEYCAAGNTIENWEECRPLPDRCGDDPSCDCVNCDDNVPEAGSCTEPAPNEIRLVCNTCLSPTEEPLHCGG